MLLLLLESSIDDPSNCNLDKLVITCEDYPSIIAIKNKCTELNSTFTFKKANKEQISIAIKRLDSKNTWKSNDIPLRRIKEFSDLLKLSMNA